MLDLNTTPPHGHRARVCPRCGLDVPVRVWFLNTADLAAGHVEVEDAHDCIAFDPLRPAYLFPVRVALPTLAVGMGRAR